MNEPTQDAKKDDNGLWAIAVYHGDTGQSTLAYFSEKAAMEAFIGAVTLMADHNDPAKLVEIKDDIGTLLCVPAQGIVAIRLVTQAGQRKLQVAGNLEGVRQQMATSDAMQAEFGVVAGGGAKLTDNMGRPLVAQPRRRN